MRALALSVFSLFATAAPLSASNIALMAVEDPNNYQALRTMHEFAEKQLRRLGNQVTIIDGDTLWPHHFARLVEALTDADLLGLFVPAAFHRRSQSTLSAPTSPPGSRCSAFAAPTTPSAQSPKGSLIPSSRLGLSLPTKSSAHLRTWQSPMCARCS